jgi:hypothetical protein
VYFNSRSFRLAAARSLAPVKKRSHVAVWTWVQKYAGCADRFRPNKRAVSQIFVDETLIRIDGHDWWLWIAYEPAIDSCLLMHLSRERTLFICYRFFQQLRKRYGRKPVFTDAVQWYTMTHMQVAAPAALRLRYGMEEPDGAVHTTTYQGQDRVCFDDHFPCRKEGCDRQHVWNWLKLFLLYVHVGMDRRRFMMFLTMDGGKVNGAIAILQGIIAEGAK